MRSTFAFCVLPLHCRNARSRCKVVSNIDKQRLKSTSTLGIRILTPLPKYIALEYVSSASFCLGGGGLGVVHIWTSTITFGLPREGSTEPQTGFSVAKAKPYDHSPGRDLCHSLPAFASGSSGPGCRDLHLSLPYPWHSWRRWKGLGAFCNVPRGVRLRVEQGAMVLPLRADVSLHRQRR